MGVTIVDTQDTAKIKKMKNFHPTGNCPIRDILCRLGDKWSMLVLITLNVNGTMRFSDIQKTISDISQRMLTVTLRTLEADGLVSRTVYAEVPPRVEYQLTETGKTLIPHIESLVGWALEHMTGIFDSREKNCPIRDILCRLGDKWSMLVLITLNVNGTMRFSDIQKTISDISQRMLTVTLRTLEADGLVSRTVYAEVPPRVEYQLTETGKTLIPHIESLVGWALEHMTGIFDSREKAGQPCG